MSKGCKITAFWGNSVSQFRLNKLSIFLGFSLSVASVQDVFASSEFQPVDKSLLVESFSMTHAEKFAEARDEKTIFSKSYKKIISAFQYVRNSEMRNQTLRNMGELSSKSHYTSNRTESNATSHLQAEVQRGFDYSLRSELKVLSTMTKDIEIFDIFSSARESVDPIRYDLVATQIRSNPNQNYIAALNPNVLDVLDSIEPDHVAWTIEPVRVQKPAANWSRTTPKESWTKVRTSMRLTSGTGGGPGAIFGLSTLDDFYRINLHTSPEITGNDMTHTINIPFHMTTVSSELNRELSVNRVSLLDVARLGKHTWLNFSYYSSDQDVRAEFIIRKGDMPLSLSAIMSLD